MGVAQSFKNIFKNLTQLNKSYTNTTVRPSIAQPYMSTDTGAKLPIFPFPLIMIYELADNVDSLRIPIETLNREIFKNGFEVVEKWKFKCTVCAKEFQYKPLKGSVPDDQPQESNDSRPTIGSDETNKSVQISGDMECDNCGSNKLLRPLPQNRKILEDLLHKTVNGNEQTIEDITRQLERDLEIADNAYLLILKNYFIDDKTGEIDPKKTEVKELLRVDPPQMAMIADSDGRIGYDDKHNAVFVCPKFEHRDKRLTQNVCDRCGTKALKAVAAAGFVLGLQSSCCV